MNLDDEDFVKAFSELIRGGGRWRNHEPEALVAQWSAFVDRCVAGYTGDAEDYFNELTSRSDLEKAMSSTDLVAFPEMRLVRREVASADEKFRGLLIPDVFPKFSEGQWWSRGIIRYSRPRFSEEIERGYGITIDVI